MTADGFAEARARMVRAQIAGRGVSDPRVLTAMRIVPRERFTRPEDRSAAFDDTPLPLGRGQTLSQPYVVAFMTEALGLPAGARVLEVGTGSGYQAAVLAAMGFEVFSIERDAELAAGAAERLAELAPDVRVRCGDGYLGWPEAAPFDGIVLTAAPPAIPEALVGQLAPGGVLVAPVGEGAQSLQRLQKDRAGGVRAEHLLDVRFVPMLHGVVPA
jgi:protein-L-isoaspartate(D-aspartate) O-methyltransferase